MTRLLTDEPVANLEEHRARGGGAAIQRAVEAEPDDLISLVEASGLRGRGGGGFPTGRKWRSVVETAAETDSVVHLVANGAEGEPATFKDRHLLDHDPYTFVEGLLIARLATRADRVVVGIKQRFQRQLERLTVALEEADKAGWPGARDVEIVHGPDDYLFGEETAMLEVIQGGDALPRLLAPYQAGLDASVRDPRPTVVNNIETLAHVATIVRHGPEWFRQVGTEDTPGTMLCTVVGDVSTPGVHELPMGTTLGEVLDIVGADQPKAVFSGTSQAVLASELFDVPMSFDSYRQAGTGLGSAGFAVYGRDRCIVQVLATLSRFLADESCGQCNPCKLGTAQITDLLDRIESGNGTFEDLEEIIKRSTTVTDQNRCYLPVGEQVMVLSVLQAFAGEVEGHLGTTCEAEPIVVPKIADLDTDAGIVTYDEPRERV